jgi:serine/threonine-protein kinase
VWVDRAGNEQPTGITGRPWSSPRLSPDGRRVAVNTGPLNGTGATTGELWSYDFERRTLSRLTANGGKWSLWSPDGTRLAYTGSRTSAGIFVVNVDGAPSERSLLPIRGGRCRSAGRRKAAGRFVGVSATTAQDIFIADRRQDDAHVLQTPSLEGALTFSPDGRFLAYASDATGRCEIYIRPFPGPGPAVQVSADGGNEPIWSRSAELFYRQGDALMAVDVTTAPALASATGSGCSIVHNRSGGLAELRVLGGPQVPLRQGRAARSIVGTQLDVILN